MNSGHLRSATTPTTPHLNMAMNSVCAPPKSQSIYERIVSMTVTLTRFCIFPKKKRKHPTLRILHALVVCISVVNDRSMRLTPGRVNGSVNGGSIEVERVNGSMYIISLGLALAGLIFG